MTRQEIPERTNASYQKGTTDVGLRSPNRMHRVIVAALSESSGIGIKKTARYGAVFLIVGAL